MPVATHCLAIYLRCKTSCTIRSEFSPCPGGTAVALQMSTAPSPHSSLLSLLFESREPLRDGECDNPAHFYFYCSPFNSSMWDSPAAEGVLEIRGKNGDSAYIVMRLFEFTNILEKQKGTGQSVRVTAKFAWTIATKWFGVFAAFPSLEKTMTPPVSRLCYSGTKAIYIWTTFAYRDRFVVSMGLDCCFQSSMDCKAKGKWTLDKYRAILLSIIKIILLYYVESTDNLEEMEPLIITGLLLLSYLILTSAKNCLIHKVIQIFDADINVV